MENKRSLIKGNEAIAESALRAGCDAYFGYPITPQNEISTYLARTMPKMGRVYIQAESEIAAISMVYGAAAAGGRTMTSSSSPGMSLKQEGISYLCGADLPAVIVDISRAGPGLGGIIAAQADYFQATRGGGHGDYHHIVLAPKGVQEAANLTFGAFELACKWRMPVMILADGIIGQMVEAVSLPEAVDRATLPPLQWAVGKRPKLERATHHISSCYLEPADLERVIFERFERYDQIAQEEVRYEEINIDRADLVLVAYGTSARVCHEAIRLAQHDGIELGLFRPISLFPFPSMRIKQLARAGKRFLAVEMSMGQMVQDVKLAVEGAAPVDFLGRAGGMVPTDAEVYLAARGILAPAGSAKPQARHEVLEGQGRR